MGNAKIPFNKPYFTGDEETHIHQAFRSGKVSGDGAYTKKCQKFIEDRYGFSKCLLTTSCTDALELAAILINIEPGDEVILPSYTFVSTANAFVLRGAKVVFVDSNELEPNMDVAKVESLITPRTKAIVPVHYAGVSCDMDAIMAIADKYGLFVVEDAAQAIDSHYKGKPTGSIGHLGAFSFHETKNIIAGEAGMLLINDERFKSRAEIVREKGTNRAAFFRGEVSKYNWVDVGSSFVPSDLLAAFLYAQLISLDDIQKKRLSIWEKYDQSFTDLKEKGLLGLPHIPEGSTNNAAMYYVLCKDLVQRNALIKHLKTHKIDAVFHYMSLHKSPFMQRSNKETLQLPNCEKYNDTLLRLPLFYELTDEDQDRVIKAVHQFFE